MNHKLFAPRVTPWTNYLTDRLDTTHDSSLYHYSMLKMMMKTFNFSVHNRYLDRSSGELAECDRPVGFPVPPSGHFHDYSLSHDNWPHGVRGLHCNHMGAHVPLPVPPPENHVYSLQVPGALQVVRVDDHLGAAAPVHLYHVNPPAEEWLLRNGGRPLLCRSVHLAARLLVPAVRGPHAQPALVPHNGRVAHPDGLHFLPVLLHVYNRVPDHGESKDHKNFRRPD